MGTEIERKFLVREQSYKTGASVKEIRQGFLNDDAERVVRIRIEHDEAMITVKGITRGVSRDEFEYSIPMEDAAFMIEKICLRPVIIKTRYTLTSGGMTWEIDEFHGENEGLVVAEVELPSAGFPLVPPEWVGEEVTGDERFYNSNLVSNPYRTWKEQGK